MLGPDASLTVPVGASAATEAVSRADGIRVSARQTARPEALGVGRCRAAVVIGTSISSASSQVANTASPNARRSATRLRCTRPSGTCSSGRSRPAARATDPGDLVVGEDLRPGELIAGALARRARARPRPRSAPRRRPRSAGRRTVPSPEIGITGSSASRFISCTQRSLGVVDDRRREDRRLQGGRPPRPRSASALARKKRVRWNSRRSQRREEDEALDPGPLGRPQQARGRQAVQLLDPGVGLVADRRREVDHGVGAAQRLALQMAVAEARQVAERDLDLDPMAARARAGRGPAPGRRGRPRAAAGAAPCRRFRSRRLAGSRRWTLAARARLPRMSAPRPRPPGGS